jgi:hypothetical protein
MRRRACTTTGSDLEPHMQHVVIGRHARGLSGVSSGPVEKVWFLDDEHVIPNRCLACRQRLVADPESVTRGEMVSGLFHFAPLAATRLLSGAVVVHGVAWFRRGAHGIYISSCTSDASNVWSRGRAIRCSAVCAALNGCTRELICQSARTFLYSSLKLTFAPYPRTW